MNKELPEPSTIALMAAVEINRMIFDHGINVNLIAQIIQKYMDKEKEKVNAN